MSDAAAQTDLARRFAGTRRLYGVDAWQRFAAASVCVIGVGGVGSWAAEALARSAIGRITLIDLDMVAESNVNRQIQALEETFGQAKIDAMARRIAAINPSCRVDGIEDFVTPDNVATMLDRGFDYVVDAIDQVRTKAAIIAWCRAHAIPLVTAGSAGGQSDPTRIALADLARTIQDPLLAKVRSRLRKDYGFPRDPRKKFGVQAVFSDEPVRAPQSCDQAPAQSGLNCAGYGSSMCVTAAFGLVAASAVLNTLASGGG